MRKEVRTFGMSMESYCFFFLLNDLFFLDKYLILYCHILFFFGEEVEAFDPRQAFDHPRQDRPA